MNSCSLCGYFFVDCVPCHFSQLSSSGTCGYRLLPGHPISNNSYNRNNNTIKYPPVYILLLQKRAAMDALHNSNASATKFTRRVGIVGAGISGLRCAEVLLSKGYEVIILEARNRIGGRVR